MHVHVLARACGLHIVWHALPPEVVFYSLSSAGGQPPDSASMQAGGLPAPVAQPLPHLNALVRGAPSPLLRWQVLDPLYSYCLAMRLYNGDWLSHAQVQRTLCGQLTPCCLSVSGSGLYLPKHSACNLAICTLSTCLLQAAP